MVCRKMNEDVAYARNTEIGCNIIKYSVCSTAINHCVCWLVKVWSFLVYLLFHFVNSWEKVHLVYNIYRLIIMQDSTWSYWVAFLAFPTPWMQVLWNQFKKKQPFFILLVTDWHWHVALKIFSHWRFFNEVKQTTSSLPFSILNKNLQYNVIQMHNWYGILRWIGYCKMSTYASNPYPSFIIVLKSVSIRDKPSSLPVLKNEIKSIYEIIYI